MRFNITKPGYDIKEVDSFINKMALDNEKTMSEQKDRIFALRQELEQTKEKLFKYSAKESNISSALLIAVDKAKQIEEGSKRIYELEIKRLRLLFNKYKTFLDDLIENNSDVTSIATTKQLIEEFKQSINDTLSNNFSVPIKTISAYDPMRALLDKMNQHIASRNTAESVQLKSTKFDYMDNDGAITYEKNQIKPISKINLTKSDKFENLVDKFLETDGEEDNALASRLFAQSGFDLKEAVNPTEDLEEIMKYFDFYNDEQK